MACAVAAKAQSSRLTQWPALPCVRASRIVESGYGATAAWVSECAIMLAENRHLRPLDTTPTPTTPPGGVLTPASCFGYPLLHTLRTRNLLQTVPAV